MTRITCYIRPHQLEAVKSAIASLGITGLSVTDVRGTGNSPESVDWMGRDENLLAFPIRSRITVCCQDDLVESVIEAIIENARTGEPGDGKIFLEKVIDVVRIRTNERGEVAL